MEKKWRETEKQRMWVERANFELKTEETLERVASTS
jgi:hypothetical protein